MRIDEIEDRFEEPEDEGRTEECTAVKSLNRTTKRKKSKGGAPQQSKAEPKSSLAIDQLSTSRTLI